MTIITVDQVDQETRELVAELIKAQKAGKQIVVETDIDDEHIDEEMSRGNIVVNGELTIAELDAQNWRYLVAEKVAVGMEADGWTLFKIVPANAHPAEES